MKSAYRFSDIPRSRVATFDTFAVGLSRHHVSALLEFDVTDSRKRIREARKGGQCISFNGWLIKVIGNTLCNHPEAAAYLYSKKKLIIFDDINISGKRNLEFLHMPITKIISQSGFSLRKDKTKFYGPKDEKEVTGITIRAGKPCAPRSQCEVEDHINKLKMGSLERGEIVAKSKRILGLISFLKQVDPKLSRRLKVQYISAIEKSKIQN